MSCEYLQGTGWRMETTNPTRFSGGGRGDSALRLRWFRAVQAGLVGVLGSASCTSAIASPGDSGDSAGAPGARLVSSPRLVAIPTCFLVRPFFPCWCTVPVWSATDCHELLPTLSSSPKYYQYASTCEIQHILLLLLLPL